MHSMFFASAKGFAADRNVGADTRREYRAKKVEWKLHALLVINLSRVCITGTGGRRSTTFQNEQV